MHLHQKYATMPYNLPESVSVHQSSGDADGRVPVISSRYCVEALGLPIKTDWQSWYLDKQVCKPEAELNINTSCDLTCIHAETWSKIFQFAGCWEVCGVPWNDNGDCQRGRSPGSPQQTCWRAYADKCIPSWWEASDKQMICAADEALEVQDGMRYRHGHQFSLKGANRIDLIW